MSNDVRNSADEAQRALDEMIDRWMEGLKAMYCVRLKKDDIENDVKLLIADYYNNRHPQAQISNDDVAIVWRCYILGNWKVLATTTVQDGMYYEITYRSCDDDEHSHIYLDAYKRWENIDYRVDQDHMGYFANPRRCDTL